MVGEEKSGGVHTSVDAPQAAGGAHAGCRVSEAKRQAAVMTSTRSITLAPC